MSAAPTLRRRVSLLLVQLVALTLLTAAGCKEQARAPEAAVKTPPAPPTAIAWPDIPPDGSQLAVQVVRRIGEGPRSGALVQFFNFSDTPLERVDIRLRYYDAQDVEVGTFPQRLLGRPLLAGKSETKLRVGGLVPPKTVRMTASARAVYRINGSRWLSSDDPPEDLEHQVIEQPLNLAPPIVP